MLHREIPFLRICIPLCGGIITGLHYSPGILFAIVAAVIISILFSASIFFNRRQENYLFGLPVSAGLFLSGLLLYTHEKKSLSDLPPEPSVFVCTLSDYPEEKAKSLMLTVRLHQKIDPGGAASLKGSMALYHKKDPSTGPLTPGDRLVLKCTPIEIGNRGNPYEFNYKFYMENLGIKYYAFLESSDILEHDRTCRRNLVHKSLIIRKKLIEMYSSRGISGARLPLVAALTLGEKSRLDPEQKENFIEAGVMHIMAVSGLHAVILSLFVLNVLFFLKQRFNILRVLTAVLFLWAFAFVTGLTPSVLRATLMFTFVQAGNLMHRKVNGINSVLASAFVLILIRPSVIFDAGFLLSYSAVIYIIAFYRNFYLLLNPGNRITDWIWQSAAVTIVAQMGTLPLTVMLFNRFPVWFILTNVIIVPLSSLAIILGCLIPVLYPVRIVSGFIGFLLDRLTCLTEALTEKAAHLPFAGLTGIGMTVTSCILLFGAIFALMNYIPDKRPYKLHSVLVLFLIWTATSTFVNIRTKTSNELIVYNMNGTGTIGIRTGKKLNIYSDTLIMDPEINRHRSAAGLKVVYHPVKEGPVFLEAGGKKIVFCNSSFPGALKYELTGVNENMIVISGKQIFYPGDKSGSGTYNISKSGAYILEL